jgi:hypothetical protein
MSEDGKYRFRLTQQLIDKLIMVFYLEINRCKKKLNFNFRKKFLIFLLYYYQNPIKIH